MAELYAKPFETIETGYNPQGGQQGGQQSEMESYLSSLPPEERQAAIQRINAPLSGEELASMAASGQKMPTLEEYAEIEKWHKTQEISFFDGLGKIAEGGEQVMADLSKAFGAMFDSPSDVASKMPATAVEAFSQGTRNFYGMLAESQNTDSVLFRVKDFLNGTGTIEDRYNQYISALKFNKDSAELMEGKQTLVMDKDMINHEVTQAMAYIADPTLFIPFGKVASTGLRAVGLGERLTMAGAKATAIKNGIIGNTIKWGAGQPLEFLGGAVRNTIDYGLEKGGQAFEATTGISGKEFAQTARMSGIGFSASGIAGYAVPYASTISDAYIAGSSAKGFGEALTLVGQTINKGKFGRGINSWAAEALDQANKSGVALSPHAKGLLNVLNAVDPLFGYAGAVIEGSSQGIVIGGGLGYLSGGEEGMYQGIGAGMALGGVGGLAGKAVADVTGGTAVARRAVQAKMVIEGHKAINPEKAMFFEGMQKATEARGNDVDLVNGIIAGIDNVAPHFEFHALTPEDFAIEGIKKGYNPETGKFIEFSALETEFGGDRPSKSKAMYILRSVGGDFVGDSKSFLTALKRASAKDSANPNKPAGNIPSNLRKYIDVAKTFEKLSKTQQDAILKEIDGQGEVATRLGGKTKLREHYDALTWSEAWTDSLVKKFESDREGARKDIVDMLAQETKKNGQLTSKGRALTDKLRAEGFLDRDGKLLRERNLLQADMKLGEFAMSKGAVIARESDGKTHMYINLNRMGDETFPHELYHTIMRESPMKKHFTDSVVQKLLGVFDADGNLVREGEVNLDQTRKFIQKYIDLTSRNDDGTLNVKKADETMKLVNEAIEEYRSTGKNKKISDKARGLLEHYTEEFGAYYFSHWLMGRNRNTLFFGGELKGIEGVVERTKDAFLDFWQSKVSKANPTFDFAKGLNASFDRSEGLGRISSMDYFMRDMVRAASNANREFFRPDSMSIENLRDFERSNGIRNLTGVDNNRRLNPREQVTQNIRLGKEAYKILTGLDKNLRTSKDVVDENGKKVITGRFSEAELDALVKGGIVPRAWADKVNQGYAMLDGTVSNIFSAGYLGKTEQTTDASYPRLTGKDVSFKNRKAVLFGIDTKVNADGTFYTLFHTLDLAVIEQRGNHLWQNTDYKNLWNGDRSSMEADFFRYISNASKASTDPNKLDSAALLEKGDGLGAKRRDVLQQMAGMALQTGDAYKHQPIAVIPEGIRHSVTTFNVDGLTMPKVESGSRYDIDMGNAHKFIRENWQPDDMVQEKTNNGFIMTHESGFKFSNINGKTTAYTSAGRKIGTFDSIKSATNAAKSEYKKVYDSLDKDVDKEIARQDQEATKFQPLDENERNLAFEYGDLFAVPSVKAFVGDRLLLRQTREEHIFQRALEAIKDPEQLYDYALKSFEKEKVIFDESNRLQNEYEVLLDSYRNQLDSLETVFNRYVDSLRPTKLPKEMYRFEDWLQARPEFKEQKKAIENQNTHGLPAGFYSLEAYLIKNDESKYWDLKALFDLESNDAKYGYTKTEEYRKQSKLFEARKEALELTLGNEVDLLREKIQKFREQNKIVLSHEGLQRAFETLSDFSYTSESGVGFTGNTSKAEQAKMFASLVKANVNAKDYSGLLEKLFAADYDDKIQTGVPFVAVTTHGTKSVRLMLTRLFEEGKLGTTFTWAESSKLGQFSAGSQKTSGSSDYQTSRRPISISPEQYKFATKKIASFNDELLNIYADALMSERQTELYGGWSTGELDKSGNTIVLNREQLLERLKIHNKDRLNKGVEELSTTFIKQEGGYNNMSFFGLAGGNEGSLFGRSEAINPEIKERIKKYNQELSDFRNGYLKDNLTMRMVQEGVTLPEPVKMQTRQLIRMDNPYVVVDPRSYEEKNLSSHMKKAIALGHDGIVFKFLADGGDKDTVFAVFSEHIKKNIKVTETSFDPVNLPRGSDESGRKILGGKDLKLHFQPTDESEAPKKIQGIKLDMTKAYDVFRQEYEESTGQSWSKDKFMQRASNWQFFGDENGFVAVRPQRSGFVKLVGMAGDNKSKLRGIQQIQQMGLPVWGMVSKDIKDIAVKRGMREPNMIERTLLKQALNSAALGDAEILGYTSDNGVRLRYPDIGEVTKYMVGSPEYYQKLRSAFGEQIKSKIGFQPTDEAEGGRVYNPKSKEFRTKFIGKWAEENPDLLKGYNIEFIDRGGMGGYRNPNAQNVRIRMQDNSKKGSTIDVGHITAQIDHNSKVATLSSNIAPEYRGNKLSYALYSEMAERLRSMGVKYVDGQIVNRDGIPIKVREKIIGNTLMIGRDGSIAKARPISQEEGKRIIQKRQASGGEWEGIDVVNELDFNARYQPSDYQGGDDYYKPKKNIFESRDEQGLLVRKAQVWNSEITGDLEAVGGQLNPDYVGWEDIGHYPQQGTTAENLWEARNSGLWYWKDDKGVKTKNPMQIDRPDFTHAEWFDKVFQYEDDRPTIYGRYEKPKYDKEGNLVEKGKLSMSSNYRGQIRDMADASFYKEAVAKSIGVPEDHIDAYLFGANDRIKAQRGYGAKDQLAIKFQPSEGEQGGNKARYDIDEAIVNKLKEKFKGYRNLTAKDMLEFIVENKGQFSPLAERLLESLDKHGLEAYVQQQTSTLGRNQKGTKGWTYHNYNPNNNTVNMLLERNVQRRRGWTLSFEELMMEEILHAVTLEKTPEPIKHGKTIEDTSSNVEHFLRNKDKYSVRYDETWKTNLGFEEEWFTIADAYRQVLKQFNTGKFLDGREIDKTAKHNISYRLSNMAEFVVGITQDKDVQTILSQIKVPKAEKSFLTKLLDAIKRIWNFDDSVMDSLLAVTSDAAERVIQREKTQMEKIGTGIFPERAKRFMSGMPEPNDITGTRYDQDGSKQTDVTSYLDPKAWYQPDEKIGTQSSNVKLLLEGMASGRILRTSSYKGLGLEDALLIAHTPDTAKIGQVTAGDKALADLQGGIFYAIANGNRIWASNFAGEGETNILVKFANRALKKNEGNKTYIMLVKADNSKIFASVDGARGVSSIFKHLSDSGVMSDLKYVKALKDSAKKHLNLTGLDGLGKDELFSKIDDAILNSEANKISFERRAKFSRSIATLLKDSGAFDSERSKKALAESFNSGFEKGFSKKEMERVFGNLMAEDIIKDVPIGHVYGAIEIVSPLSETKESNHRGYNASIVQESGEPARLIMFDKTAHATEVLNKKSGERILKKDPTRHLKDSEGNYVHETDETGELVLTKKGKPKRIVEYKGEGSYISYTGGNIPYQEVRGKKKMPFQPAEGWRDWQSERTSVGSVIKNTAGYLIMVQNGKFKVYNPAKVMIGIYDNEDQAKRRVQKDEPRR